MAKDLSRSIFSGFLVGIYKRNKVYQLLQEHGAPLLLNEKIDEILNKLRDYQLRHNARDGPYTPLEAAEEFLELLREYQSKSQKVAKRR